jgi:N-sulfoglucosamine sulfohydrolase
MVQIYLVAILFVAAILPADAHSAPRNVVLFVADDQGRTAGCYGNAVIKTPHLDALAAQGTRFDYAFCTTASCSPSRSVILTGLHNHATGQYGLEHAVHHFRSFERLRSLPVLLAEAGYRTARIGKYHVAPERVYRFDEALRANARNPVAMAERCREFIAGEGTAEQASSGTDPERPFFLYFCTSDPHRSGDVAEELPERPDRFGNKPAGASYPGVEPLRYDPAEVVVPPFLPDTPACRAELAQYYESVSRVDAGLGRLVEVLKETGVYDDTLVIYISDNGVPFPGAKTTVYEPGLRLPCIVRNPYAKKRGVVSEALVSWVDITPTILDFAEVDPPADVRFHGRSFLPVLEEARPKGWDEVYASHTFHEVTMYYPMRVVRDRRWKLIWNIAHALPFPFASDLWNSATWQATLARGENARYGQRTVTAFLERPEFELYDLERDPHETRNLAGEPEHRTTLEKMQAKLEAFQKRTGDPWILKWKRE